MTKQIEDVEHVFNQILEENEVQISGMSFEVKDKVFTCNCILKDKIILVLPKITTKEQIKIKEFKNFHPGYKVIVFTNDIKNTLLLKSADEIYTLEHKDNFVDFIKRNL